MIGNRRVAQFTTIKLNPASQAHIIVATTNAAIVVMSWSCSAKAPMATTVATNQMVPTVMNVFFNAESRRSRNCRRRRPAGMRQFQGAPVLPQEYGCSVVYRAQPSPSPLCSLYQPENPTYKHG